MLPVDGIVFVMMLNCGSIVTAGSNRVLCYPILQVCLNIVCVSTLPDEGVRRGRHRCEAKQRVLVRLLAFSLRKKVA